MNDVKIRWSPLKSERLKRVRGASFEEVLASRFVLMLKHPTRENQSKLLYWHKNYIRVMPFCP